MSTNFDLVITVKSATVDGQVEFYTSFNRPLTMVEKTLMAQEQFAVNLSRGTVRKYALDRLDTHNGHGATWNNGSEGKHGTIAQSQYLTRVKNEISSKWEAFKAAVIKANAPKTLSNTSAQVFFSANGS